MSSLRPTQRGFSLIELLVVISILLFFASVVLTGVQQAQKQALDTRRATELDQYKKAMELYKVDHGYYPRESDGANGKIGEGSGLDTILEPYMSKIVSDPRGPGTPYYYYYDGNATCDSQNIAVLFAVNMEAREGNGNALCSSWGGEGGAGTANAYHVFVGESDG